LYPVVEDLKPALFLELIRRGDLKDVIVFTRTKHRANRLAEILERAKVSVARIHGNRSQSQRTLALDGFKRGQYQVLVATDIVARGIDVEELSHVVNFDVPNVPEDYIHRVGRTARADATGDAFTFVSPDEETDLRAIERAVGRQLPRITVSGFDYKQRPAERFEVPIGERIAAIRARRAEERKRSKEKAERRTANQDKKSQPQRPKPSRDKSPAAPSQPKPHAGTAGARPAKEGTRERVRGAWSPARPAEPSARRDREPHRDARARPAPSRGASPAATRSGPSAGRGPYAPNKPAHAPQGSQAGEEAKAGAAGQRRRRRRRRGGGGGGPRSGGAA
jgi:ATP-dependent RNA helicase RhlE